MFQHGARVKENLRTMGQPCSLKPLPIAVKPYALVKTALFHIPTVSFYRRPITNVFMPFDPEVSRYYKMFQVFGNALSGIIMTKPIGRMC